jgi:hypothetical protein
MIRSPSLDDLLGTEEPYATFHDGLLVSLTIDFEKRELMSEWELCVGDAESPSQTERERSRRGHLIFDGLMFWVVEPPEELYREEGLPWLTDDGPLYESTTGTGKQLARLVPPAASGWYLFFSDRNAYAYCASATVKFKWLE